MKIVLNALTVLMLSSTICRAADSVDIDVTVTADAAACTPTLSNNGIVDFGKRSATELSSSHFTQWGNRSIILNISCEASTGVAISARDSRPESISYGQDVNGNTGPGTDISGQKYISNPARLFGLGKTEEGKNIGNYAIIIDTDNAQAQDGGAAVAVSVVGSNSVQGPWTLTSPAVLPSDMAYYFTFARKNSTTVQPITTATVPLQVSASIASGLASGSAIFLDGQATISLVYL